MVNMYAHSESEAFSSVSSMIERCREGMWEVWEIEPNKYGLKYVVITRKRTPAKTPKIAFKRLIARITKHGGSEA